MSLTRLEIVEALPGEYGQPIVVLPWWRELLAAVDDPVRKLLLLMLTRQNGKTQCMFSLGVSECLTVENALVLAVSAAGHQLESVFERKVRRPLTTLLQRWGAPDLVSFTKRGFTVPSMGSAFELANPNEYTIAARSPTIVIVDEARDVPDAVFTALAPSVIGAGGKLILGSSAGLPRGFFYELVMQAEREPSPDVWLYRGGAENLNPYADQRMLGFLRKQIAIVSPAAAERELGNQFAEGGDELIPAALIERAIDDGLGELPSSGRAAFAFYDLSRRRDLTSRTVVTVGPATRPEAADHLSVVSLRIWDPKASASGEVDFASVREDLLVLPRRFPHLQRVLVDAGAESSSLLPWAKTVPSLALKVEPFVASVSSNMEMWSALVARLNAGTVSIPRHERLLQELRNLKREEFAFGSKFRVVDSSRKFHRDVSLTVAGAVFAAVTQEPDPGPTAAVIMPRVGNNPNWRARHFS